MSVPLLMFLGFIAITNTHEVCDEIILCRFELRNFKILAGCGLQRAVAANAQGVRGETFQFHLAFDSVGTHNYANKNRIARGAHNLS